MRFTCAARTDVGVVRAGNEDNYLMLADRGLFIVADGMGGHAAGEVASEMAVEIISRELGSLRGIPDEEAMMRVQRAVVAANSGHDLAVLKIRDAGSRKFEFLRLGRSDDLLVGETVITIGNPFGYQNTCTTGVLSESVFKTGAAAARSRSSNFGRDSAATDGKPAARDAIPVPATDPRKRRRLHCMVGTPEVVGWNLPRR